MTKREDRAWKDYGDRFRREVLPKILNSAIFLSIQSEEFDVKMATEMGAALLMDKPLLLVCPPGRHIPERLRRAADIVIDNWDAADPDAQERFADALKKLDLPSR
jgi:hypothetical protein